MTIKPFAIQGADLTLGGVSLQAGTTGVVIPGVTRATSYKIEEVNDTEDQTFSNFPLDGEVVVVDYVQYQAIVADTGGTFADFTATTDGEGYIDDIEVNGQGSYTQQQATTNASEDMYAYIGTASASDRPIVPEDWVRIPFRPKMRAGEVETIGGGSGGASITYREVVYPTGEADDTAGTIAVNSIGDAYICLADYFNDGPSTYTVQQYYSYDIGQDPGYMILTIDPEGNEDEADVTDLWAARESAIPSGWSISSDSMSTQITAVEIGIWPEAGPQGGRRYIRWPHGSTDPTTIADGDFFTVTFTPEYRRIWTSISKAEALETQNSAIREETDSTTGQNNLVIGTANAVVINTNEGEHEFTFTTAGAIKFPDGTTQTTAYTGQAGGGSGELYIMANVDGNIITSTDGTTWGEPVASGVPVISGGGPFTAAIGKVEIHGGVIVYTRCEVGDIAGSGLYYSTEIGTATLCAGTDSNPGGDLYWNEVRFFHETDTWVAVGYVGPGDGQKRPIIAYSTDGISWTVSEVDSNFVADHNVGNWPWEMTDVAYNPTDAAYVFVGRVGGDNHAGAFVTNDLTVTFNADIWIDVPLNAKFIQNWPVTQFGGPPGYMLIISDDIQDAWSVTSPLTDTNNWDPGFIGPNDGWYQDSMIDAVGYVPVISEMTANGSTVVIVTEDGQVAIPTPGPMIVSVPVPYTSTITGIIRNSTGGITRFTTVPAVNDTNVNWQDVDTDINIGAGTTVFHVTVVSGVLTACTLVSSTDTYAINETVTLPGAFLGGTTGVDDVVVTVTGIPTTIIEFTNTDENGGFSGANGEKIIIAGVTSADASEPGTSNQSYNGTYYVKKIINGNGPDTYELYTNQTCTTPWDTSTFWPINNTDGTLTWSHGQYFDAAGCANSYYYIGNDDEKIFRSTDGGYTWVEQADLTGEWLNDFAYGTWGSGASSLTELTVESPFVIDLFGPKVYFSKSNYGSEVDNIDTNVAITRGDYQGPYNPITDDNWNDNTSGPTNTEWNMDGWGDLSNVTDRNYDTWENIAHGARTPGRELVMHDTENNKYYAIMFHSFQGGENGGAFSYTRRLINTACWFTRSDGDDSGYGDEIDTGIKIVRGNNQGIYNDLDEGGWNDSSSPSGTLWNAQGWSDLTDVTTRQYLNFEAACKSQVGKNVCGVEFVMKDTINDNYYAIKFSFWGNQGDNWPGFAYTRRKIDLTKVSSNVKFADGTIQTTAITEQRLGVLPQKLVNNSGTFSNNNDRYLTLDDIGKHLYVTTSGIYIYITDSVHQEFPIGSVITIINKSGGTIYLQKDNDDEDGTIYGSAQNDSGTQWYINDSGSGNMVTLIKIEQSYDGGAYSNWMIAGTDIGVN